MPQYQTDPSVDYLDLQVKKRLDDDIKMVQPPGAPNAMRVPHQIQLSKQVHVS